MANHFALRKHKAHKRVPFQIALSVPVRGNSVLFRALTLLNSFPMEEASMMKKLLLSTALSAAVASAAFAQSTSTPSSSDPAPAAKSDSMKSEGSGKSNFVSAQKPDQWLASKFKGTDVLGSDNQ